MQMFSPVSRVSILLHVMTLISYNLKLADRVPVEQ